MKKSKELSRQRRAAKRVAKAKQRDEVRRTAASRERADAMKRRRVDEARVMAMNDGLAASHTLLTEVVATEYASIQERMEMKDQADMACLQAALLIAFAQEYTRSVLLSAPVQIRGLGKEWIFSRAQKMRETIFKGQGVETAMEPMPGPEPQEGERKTDSGLILLS